MTCIQPTEYDVSRHDWHFEKKEKQGEIIFAEKTQGIRLTAKGGAREFITVLYSAIAA